MGLLREHLGLTKQAGVSSTFTERKPLLNSRRANAASIVLGSMPSKTSPERDAMVVVGDGLLQFQNRLNGFGAFSGLYKGLVIKCYWGFLQILMLMMCGRWKEIILCCEKGLIRVAGG